MDFEALIQDAVKEYDKEIAPRCSVKGRFLWWSWDRPHAWGKWWQIGVEASPQRIHGFIVQRDCQRCGLMESKKVKMTH